MPDGGPIRAAQLAAALQWDRGRWIWLLLIVLFFHTLLALGDSVTLSLRYDRAALAAGGWWRLLTAHVVHLDLHHLILNDLGLVLMWSLFAGDYDAVDWTIIVFSGALAISSGLGGSAPASTGMWEHRVSYTRSWPQAALRIWRRETGTAGYCSAA